MEHIPPAQVDAVISSIMGSVPKAFFQIALVPDRWGKEIGHQLHLTVEPAEWWAATFERLGYRVIAQTDLDVRAQFIIERQEH